MKILSLNIWGGRVHEPLIKFVQGQAKGVDVFCFQEVFSSEKEFTEPTTGATHHIFQRLAAALPCYMPYFFPAQDGPGMDGQIYSDIQYGLAYFVKKPLLPADAGDIFIFGNRNSYLPGESYATLPRNLAYLKFSLSPTPVTIYNFHGLWTGGGKGDTESRREQSHKIKEFIDSNKGLKVLCGDFNLLPDTQSLAILEEGLCNQITTRNISSTRTSFYTKEPKFADYILTSPELTVNQFMVLPDEVSDHAALIVDVELDGY